MAIANPYQQYQQQSVMTASPGELTLMLYNGCIKFIRQAKLGIEAGDIERANNSIIRCQDILEELMVTLKPEYDISASLSALYDYMYNRLIDANIGKDLSILDEVLEMVTEIRDTWAEAIKINRRLVYGG
ncbi:MAG: flagellar export chaperone FliS [Clostridiales bacterium]|jgi:flagellar protein FliS|nr:flagellar export chaperone FliS [Clostridiales bacterium]